MKRLGIIYVFSLLCSIQSMAQSMLRVRLADNSPFTISVDSRYFNKRGTSVTVGELPYGRHRLRIFTYNEGRRGRGYEDELFAGNVKTHDRMTTLFVFDPYSGETHITEQPIGEFTDNHPPANDAGRFREQYDERDAPATNTQVQPDMPAASPVPPEKIGSLTDAKIDQLKTKVAAKKTDTEKLNTLKDELKNEQLATNQVGDMMDWLSFESTKVEFAKWAYSITADKEYYTDLENKFTYKNYLDDLDKFIKSQK
jgi:hypothetical protein